MINKLGVCWGWRLGLMSCCLVWPIVFCGLVEAQSIREDTTLGAEGSVIDRNVQIRNRDSDRIRGGARRGGNLFHSFEQFDVDEGRGAYFDNPTGVENIFSRVTGNDASEIRGVLGVIQAGSNDILGNANLFFMNPNGILFGPSSSLDVGGSFAATTANAIGFGDLGFFSATNPEVPSQLLTIDPSAFLFNQIGNGAIVSQAGELDSAPGKSLLFLGGNVSLNGSALFSSGGRIEVGGLASVGAVQLASNDDALQLEFPVGISRANIALQNSSFIVTTVGGSIGVDARNLELSGSNIFSAVIDGQSERSGDIALNLTGTLNLDRSSVSQNSLRNSLGDTGNLLIDAQSVQLVNSAISNGGQRNAGDIRLTVLGELKLDDSQINAVNLSGSTGSGSDTFIDAQSIDLTNQSLIGSTSNGQGAAGGVTLVARDAITLSNSSIQSNANSLVSGITSRATSGDVNIQARLLSLQEGSRISTSSLGAGRSGNIHIDTRDAITLNNGFIEANAIAAAESGGDIALQTGQLSLFNYSQINAYTSEYFETGELGRGNAGNININAQSLSLTNAGGIYTSSVGSRGNAGNITIQANDVDVTGFLRTDELAKLGFYPDQTSDRVLISEINSGVTDNNFNDIEVQGGTVTIEANRLRLNNGGSITTDVQQARGRAGNIIVHATDSIEISGRARFNIPSGLSSNLQTDGVGEGGSIQVRTGQLNMSDAGQIAAATASQGDAGTVSVEASEINLSGLSTRITTQVDDEARGNGGDLNIKTQRLQLQDNAEISTNTFGIGNAGNLTVNAGEIDLTDTPDPQNADTGLLTIVAEGAAGNAGNLTINTERLIINNGAGVSSGTLGRGQAGDVSIRANEQISLNNGGIASSVAAGATGDGGRLSISTPALHLRDNSSITASTAGNGDAGNLAINAPVLFLQGESNITASTSGQGNAGGINIRGADSVSLANSSISTEVTAQNAIGQGGNIDIVTGRLNLDQAQINSSTSGQGNTGSITVQASQGINLNTRSSITTDVRQGAIGDSRNITLQTPQLSLNNSEVSAATDGRGRAGSIAIQGTASNTPATRVSLNNSTLSTEIQDNGTVNSQDDNSRSNIDLRTRQLDLNTSSITASTSGQGNAGNIRIRDADTISLDDQSQITTTVNSGAIGEGGDITLQTGTLGLDNRSRISSSTAGQGDTGAISIDATDSIQLRDRSQITSEVQTNATGNSQQITIRTPDLSLRGDSTISAATNGTGRAGDVRVLEADRVSLSNSTISTEVGNNATVPDGSDRDAESTARSRSNSNPQNNITIDTRSLNLDNNAQITASTKGQGNAGDITVNADTVDISNGSRLTTSTSSDRSAGNIVLNVQDATEINGDGSGIFANTTANGNGGSITVNTETLNLTDQARISARSTGRGEAGDIRINTQNFNATNSTLETAARRSSGGTIQINPNNRTGRITLNNSTITTNSGDQGGNIGLGAEQIILRGDSDLTTSSGGDGGNIDLTAASIIAFDDSDILANSRDASGGNITLDTPAFFGSGYVPDQSTTGNLDDNGRVDINATGSTASGTITTPDTSFIQNSLSDLPDNSIDTDQLLANSCIVRDRDQPQGQFIITGADGLPDRPGSVTLPDFPTGEIRNIPDATEATDQPWQLGDPVVEPQGVYRLPDGRLVMSRECD